MRLIGGTCKTRKGFSGAILIRRDSRHNKVRIYYKIRFLAIFSYVKQNEKYPFYRNLDNTDKCNYTIYGITPDHNTRLYNLEGQQSERFKTI
jgi:hypothetical protein